MRVLSVVGARPNFMKVAPVMRVMRQGYPGFANLLVHTGQHYDANMNDVFFRELGMPQPDVNLEVGSGSHAQQTALVMSRIEPVIADFAPDIVLVVGDVNSTLAAALVAKKLDVNVAHIEAGLRSFDRRMPEEINRICTDAISDLLFTTDRTADSNLAHEGIPEDKIYFVGNVMIDSLLAHRRAAAERRYAHAIGFGASPYAVLTLHRPANVDEPAAFEEILLALLEIARDLPILFPVHPRTRRKLDELGWRGKSPDTPKSRGIHLLEPLGYVDFLSLTQSARLVLTDSGGLQEETTILGIPCVTLRNNTERPVTISEGTNRLGGTRRATIVTAAAEALSLSGAARRIPEKWDGKAAHRIAEIIVSAKAR
jgi:UDP-N-acetylglucosamine 2-epimerase (non-hydrolysing)